MKEEFLYNVWQFKRWNSSKSLKTTQGEVVEVISPGVLNSHAGPDFFNAKVRINGVLWVGNVEIHVRGSDWFLHGHEQDPNYENIILHVVYQNDLGNDLGNDFPNFPTLELRKYLDDEVVNAYDNLQKAFHFIPCEGLINTVAPEIISSTKTALILEKWQQKEDEMTERLSQLAGDWEQLLFERIAYSFGLKINAEAFQWLAKTIDVKILSGLSLFQKEALIFGQAGFLEKVEGEYPEKLKKEYAFLKMKWKLNPLEVKIFNFFRLRPYNFPTLRLAQWAYFLNEYPQIFSNLKEDLFYEKLNEFQNLKTSQFWENHFTLGKESKRVGVKRLSADFIRKLLINAFLPVHVFYLKTIGKDLEGLLDVLEEVDAENNSVIQSFKGLKIPVKSALDTQALLFLKKNYCNQKKCLNCKIGNHILNHVR